MGVLACYFSEKVFDSLIVSFNAIMVILGGPMNSGELLMLSSKRKRYLDDHEWELIAVEKGIKDTISGARKPKAYDVMLLDSEYIVKALEDKL